MVVRSTDSPPDDDQPSPEYLVPLTENGTGVPGDDPTGVSVEVHDAYNNPVESADVSFSTTDGVFSGDATVTSGANGRATAQFDLAGNDSATVTATLVDEGVAPSNASAITLRRQGAGEGTNDINPSDAGDVILEGAVQQNQNEVEVSFNNTAGSTQRIERARISFYLQEQNSDRATSATVGTGADAVTFDVPGATKSSGTSIGTGSGQTVDIAFSNENSGSNLKTADAFFILTLWFDGVGQETYFIAVDGNGSDGSGGSGGPDSPGNSGGNSGNSGNSGNGNGP